MVEQNTNIFFHAPKELSTDAFIVWLIYYLYSKEEYKKYKQAFFDTLILKKEDRGRAVCNIELKRQENHIDVLLTFDFEDNGEKASVLFEDKTWGTPSNQLARYREIYPKCYRYLYYKLGYINLEEKKIVFSEQYDVITAELMSSVLENFADIHPLIKMYLDYIKHTFVDEIYSYKERLFVKHDYDVLWSADAQKYLCDKIVENLNKHEVSYKDISEGSSFGRPWTEINIISTKEGYDERLFWRVDIRSGKYYIRLNQYAVPSDDEIEYKRRRLNTLRHEANKIVDSISGLRAGEVTNSGIKEWEVIIFFLEENDMDTLMNAIPVITKRMIEVFKKLPSKEEMCIERVL